MDEIEQLLLDAELASSMIATGLRYGNQGKVQEGWEKLEIAQKATRELLYPQNKP